MDNAIEFMPKMLIGNELKEALSVLPHYAVSIRKASVSERLIELSRLYDVYRPSPMTEEIYCKLYLALLRSLQKKQTKIATMQGNLNRQGISNGIIGGSDSFTILGMSGIGKSSAINRAISLIAPKPIIITQEPYARIAPIITVQTPYDCSVKGLLLEILREVDKALDTNYHSYALKVRATTDSLIGSVANVCLHSVGLLIIDEFQNICSKNGANLMGTLLNLINSSGISVAMVGTLETKAFFSNASFQLSRRSLGLEYGNLHLDDCFFRLCRTLTSYSYVKNDFTLTDEVVQWLYSHSNGVTSVVVSLVKDAQEIAILDGSETLSIASLNRAYNQRLALLHNHIEFKSNKHSPSKSIVPPIKATMEIDEDKYISNIVTQSKKSGEDLFSLLRNRISIIEVSV
jgi:hypothetical protein